MEELLAQITGKWKADPEEIMQVGEKVIQETTSRLLEHRTGGEVNEQTLDKAYEM